MRIVGCLVWYDEQPSMLAEAVHGLAKVVDEIVAVDGAYAMFPSATVRSHPDQTEAIVRAAETENVGLTVHRPRQLFFGNEIEKRNLSLQLAAPFCEEGDWILAWDADYHLHRCDPAVVRHELETTDHLAATYTILESVDYMAGNDFLKEYAVQRPVDTRYTIRTRGIYRWAPDLHYENAHFLMKGTYQGVERWVYGPDLVGGKVPGWEDGGQFCSALNLNKALVVYHRRGERPLSRSEAADEYYRRRDLAGIETIDFGDGPVDPDTGKPLAAAAG